MNNLLPPEVKDCGGSKQRSIESLRGKAGKNVSLGN